MGNLTHRVAKLSTTVESLTKTVAEMDSKISDLLIQESTLTNDSLNEILPLATEKSLKTFNRDLSDVTYHLNFVSFLVSNFHILLSIKFYGSCESTFWKTFNVDKIMRLKIGFSTSRVVLLRKIKKRLRNGKKSAR